MALNKSFSLTFDISDFSLGWDNINKPTTLEPRTFTDIKNFNLTRRRGLEKRGGISPLYSTTAAASTDVTSLYEYKAPDGNDYILTAISTKIMAYYNATWNNLKTGLTSGKKYSFETHRGLCYGVNGLDDNFKLHNTTSYAVGIAPPLGAPAVATAAAGTESLYTNHGIANIDYIGELRQDDVTGNAERTMIAQSFMLDRDYSVTVVKLNCRKIGSPSGNMTVEIHSAQGTGAGTIVGAASANVAVPTSTEFSTKTFTLGTAASCSANTTYYIVIKSTHTVSSTSFVEFGFDWVGGYPDGQYFEIDGSGNWTLFSDTDLGFEVWGIQTVGESLLEHGSIISSVGNPLRQDASNVLLAQSFEISATRDVTSIKMALKKIGSPAGNVWAEIHTSRTGTHVTRGLSDNIVTNGVSDNVSISSNVTADYEWVEFSFSTAPTLTGSTTYYLVLYGSFTPAATDYIRSVRDTGYSSGSMWLVGLVGVTYTWVEYADYDNAFKIYGINTTASAAETHSLSDITQIRDLREGTGSTSQQMIVQEFTVNESGTCPYAKVYMSKTGSPTGNIWAEIHSDPSGTSASKDSSDFIVGSASANVDIANDAPLSSTATFPTFGWVTFTFGTTDPPLTSGNTYYLVIYGDYGISKTAFINTALDKTPPGYLNGKAKWEIDEAEDWTEVPGQDIIFEIYLTTTGLAATYYYRYTYVRSGWLATESNPSDVSIAVKPSTQDVDVGVVASDDPQVDGINIWRTLANETTPFFRQNSEPHANSTATISDSVSDNFTTILWDTTNNVPPKATFIKLHKDRMFYANCPDEDAGGSLVMWSKTSNGETVPSANYQHFDKDDGEEITGVASLGTYFFVFKPNKIGVLDIDSPEIWYLGHGVGCIAPWAILTFKDKIIFLAEEGWKATDGKDIWDLSSNISGLLEDGYITINEKENYSVAFYPEKEQLQFLINHSTLDPKVIVGHFLVPLILKPTGISELVKQNIMGWTYHEYDYDELTCIGNYTDSDGITRVIAGASDGFVYLLDSGTDDDGEDITTKLRTDWLSLGTPRSITKTIRKGYLSYGASGTISLGLTVDIDFAATDETSTLTGSTVDVDNSINEDFPLTGTGELFRFTLFETSSKSLDIMGLTIQFRSDGIR